MSDITINVHHSEQPGRRRPPAGNRERRRKWFHKRTANAESSRHFPPRQQPATHPPLPRVALNRRPPRPSAAAGASTRRAAPSMSARAQPTGRDAPSPRQHEAPAHRAVAPSGRRPVQGAAGIPTKFLAIDCEMVGSGPKGYISQLARCSLVSYDGDVVYDKFISPTVPVTDYRTRWSGIRRRDLVNATPFPVARREILKLLMGKVVIGHAVHNDFKVLNYFHPAALTRDTSRIPLLNLKAGFEAHECASLKRLTKAVLHRDIQAGSQGHSSVEDARATMELYKVVQEEWEGTLATRSQTS